MQYIFFYVNDIFFRSQISVNLKGISISIVFTDDSNKPDLENAALVVFDLSTDFFLPHLKEVCSKPTMNTLAFLPHIEKERALLAKNLGCKRVVSRKEFSENMQDIITEAISSTDTSCTQTKYD